MAEYRYPQRQIMSKDIAGNVPHIPSNSAPAMVYVPWQTDISVYDDMKALERGTLFISLDKPFAGRRCK